jgi:hypothetical protein
MSVLAGLVAPMVPATAYGADAKSAICDGITTTTGNGCDVSPNSNKIRSALKLVLEVLSFIVGIAAVIMIIIGGFRYVISAGDGANTAGAKNTILYALIGLVIVAFAQLIVKFVLNKST